jgi:uncharacterized protein
VLPGSAQARDVPALRGPVNDYAGVLSVELRSRVEAQLLAYKQKTGHELALLTVPSLDGDAIEEFSIRVMEAWKLGDQARDDAALLLVAMADRRMRIEVNYGLEGELTDATSSRIIRDVITPEFKRGDPEAGIVAGLSAIMAATGGEGIPLPERQQARRSQRRSVGFPPFLLLALFVLPFLFGGRGGPGGRRRSWGAAPLFFGGGLGGGGLGGGRGGGGFGGGGFGGGGGGGGFGGGGGSGGGGGASGSW